MNTVSTRSPCRIGATEHDLRREADRSELYGACLKLIRPQTRLKREIAEAAEALVGPVRAFFERHDDAAAAFARTYATVCGATAFLEAKRAEYRARRGTPDGAGNV